MNQVFQTYDSEGNLSAELMGVIIEFVGGTINGPDEIFIQEAVIKLTSGRKKNVYIEVCPEGEYV